VVEKKPLGTAGSLSLITTKSKDPLIVLNGDIITQVDISDMIDFHNKNGFEITAGVYDYIHQIPFGVVQCQGRNIQNIEEKPIASWQVASGIYVVSSRSIKLIPKGEHFTMPDLINMAIKKKKRVGAYKIEEEWIDIGRKSELNKARGTFVE
ncbi:MAG: sugar phosphate nucleotidyltransferase, partial [Acidobacteria bacterium]|nr:sugar phosphate nucleotidyltransferase [Acidobacteriota bacterium]